MIVKQHSQEHIRQKAFVRCKLEGPQLLNSQYYHYGQNNYRSLVFSFFLPGYSDRGNGAFFAILFEGFANGRSNACFACLPTNCSSLYLIFSHLSSPSTNLI